MICPDCKWETPTGKYKKTRDKNIHIYKDYEEPRENSYPLILDFYVDWKGRKCYREVHYCPNCHFEFEQQKIEE